MAGGNNIAGGQSIKELVINAAKRGDLLFAIGIILILVILISCEDSNNKTDKDIKTDTPNPVITDFDRYEIYEIDSESVVIRGYHSLEEITVKVISKCFFSNSNNFLFRIKTIKRD